VAGRLWTLWHTWVAGRLWTLCHTWVAGRLWTLCHRSLGWTMMRVCEVCDQNTSACIFASSTQVLLLQRMDMLHLLCKHTPKLLLITPFIVIWASNGTPACTHTCMHVDRNMQMALQRNVPVHRLPFKGWTRSTAWPPLTDSGQAGVLNWG